MKIIISNSSKDPIYEQITDQIKTMIMQGQLDPGDSLPSIRGLARDLQVSVITTKRAYEELEKEAFIDTIPGKGSFVAMQNKELMREKKLKTIEDKLAEIVKQAKLLNISKKEIKEILEILFEEV